MNFVIGNTKTATFDYNRPLLGTLYDTRIYNRILSADEILTLNNSGTVTNGLIFQAFCVKDSDVAAYDGQALTSDQKVLDNIRLAVGTPNASPTCEVY
jgi:hypothetical protein